MRLFFIIFYSASIISGFGLFYSLGGFEISPDPVDIFSVLICLFLLIFGIYGIYGEFFLRKMKQLNSIASEADISYYIKKKGFWGKLFLFPFIHIKSRYSFVIAFFGSLTLIVILMIVYFGMIKKIMS
jgi:hypothetical protein